MMNAARAPSAWPTVAIRTEPGRGGGTGAFSVQHDRLDLAHERRPSPRRLAPAEPIQDVGLVLQRVPELIQARAIRATQVQGLGDADELVDLVGEPPGLVERGQQREELRHDLPGQPGALGPSRSRLSPWRWSVRASRNNGSRPRKTEEVLMTEADAASESGSAPGQSGRTCPLRKRRMR